MSTLPGGLIAFGPNTNCTLDLCPLEASIFRYRPSVPANSIFIGIFGLCLIAHTIQGVLTRSWGFMACMVAGCVLEIAGYAGRIVLYDNPFSFNGFLAQISNIYHLDRSISRFDPRVFYWMFIPCDIISLILQAVGGAFSATGTTKKDVDTGVDISLAGLIFQVITLVLFCLLFTDYLLLCRKSNLARSGMTKAMTVFLTFLFLSILFVLIRCTFRIVELHEGYFSHFFRQEGGFIGLESAVMCAAVICLNIGHPGKILTTRTGKRSEPQSLFSIELNDGATL
ncbi:parasitic phase-specific psp-1 [Fusarium circinatum]|uniref:Parasitic phase-specific psp-1 n=1 Tax=Fusarium circinatum TaxID=48490 RepID=A0A8H5UE55_FUSCI|nr:parasitic phase-specific psp-1 [Fusarium circinatum]